MKALVEAYSKEGLNMSFSHAWLDILHHKDMGVATNICAIFHQLYFFSTFLELNFIDDIIKSPSVDVELRERHHSARKKQITPAGFAEDIDKINLDNVRVLKLNLYYSVLIIMT